MINTKDPRTTLIISSSAILLLLVGAWLVFNRPTGGMPGTAATTTDGVTYTGDGTITVTPGTVETPTASVKAPDYMKPLSIKMQFTDEVKQTLEAQYTATQKVLQSKPTDFGAWANLASVKKIAGDYAGAEEIWVYLTKVYPSEASSFGNLGDLYMNFVKNYTKSEAMYKQAIKLNSGNTEFYRSLFSLYTDYGYKAGTNAAPEILKQGLESNPKAIDLMVLLGRYYAGKGDVASAKAQYQAAIKVAEDAGNTTLAGQIQGELDTLK